MKEHHIGIVTRNINKASGSTNEEQTARVSSRELAGAVYFKAETLYDGEYPLPALPSFDFASQNSAGLFWVPKVGDTLVIEMDISLDLPNPTYVSCLYTKENTIHRDFKKHYPWRMGWITNKGHRLIFDDMASHEAVKIEHTFGSYLLFGQDGSIDLKSRKIIKRDENDEINDEAAPEFARLFIDGISKKITLEDYHGNKLEMGTDNTKITDKSGNTITMEAAKITVNAVGNAEVIAGGDAKVEAAGKCEVKGATVELNGNASEVTSKNAHSGVIDLITGAPIIASTTVKMDA